MSDQSEIDHAMGGFAPVQDASILYMQRLRDFYLVLGYSNLDRSAQDRRVSSAKLSKPLNPTKVGLVITAAPCGPNSGDQGLSTPYGETLPGRHGLDQRRAGRVSLPYWRQPQAYRDDRNQRLLLTEGAESGGSRKPDRQACQPQTAVRSSRSNRIVRKRWRSMAC